MPRRASRLLPLAGLALTAAFFAVLPTRAAGPDPASVRDFNDNIRPLLDDYCGACHSDGSTKGNFSFKDFKGYIEDVRTGERWHEVMNTLAQGVMPPPDKAQPDEAERLQILDWVQKELKRAEHELAGATRGVLRRMNRREYEHTIEDLLGIPPVGADGFAVDGRIEGLDNQGAALFMSPTQMERFMDAASATLDIALPDSDAPLLVQRIKGEDIRYQGHPVAATWLHPEMTLATYERELAAYNALPEEQRKIRRPPQRRSDEIYAMVAWMRQHDFPNEVIPGRGQIVYHPIMLQPPDHQTRAGAKLIFPLTVPADGWYRLKIRAGAGPETKWDRAPMRIGFFEQDESRGDNHRGNNALLLAPVSGTFEQPSETEALVWLPAGKRRYFLHKAVWGWETDVGTDRLVNEMAMKRIPRREYYRGLLVESFNITGPVAPARAFNLLFPEGLDAPYTRDKAAAALARLATRAFRRPVTPAYVERYLGFHSDASRSAFLDGVRHGAAMILSSPKFLYLAEPAPETPSGSPAPQLGDHELATRLSYFLWCQAPDDELLALANAGRLRDPAVLLAQTRRLLADPRADRMVRAVAAGWLGLGRIKDVAPDTRRFAHYTANMPGDLTEQTLAFVTEVFRGNRSALDILSSDWDMLNEPLARYYGLKELGVEGIDLRPVLLPPAERARRGGVLAHASILTMTSNGTRTSPIVRGAWVLDHLLGQHPPPAPPNVPALEGEGVIKDQDKLTLRQIVELHKADPRCASCHRLFDPYGMALEHYDPVGRWRDHEMKFVEQFENPDNPQNSGRFFWEKQGPIDASGTLVDGAAFNGPAELRELLLQRSDRFTRHLAGRFLAYALGRPVGFADHVQLEQLHAQFAASGYRLAPLFESIVLSDAFLRP